MCRWVGRGGGEGLDVCMCKGAGRGREGFDVNVCVCWGEFVYVLYVCVRVASFVHMNIHD